MTTLKSLAQHLNLSQATVSRALNGFPEVGEKTRKRVLLAAANLGYKPNLSARKLATGRSGMIGIVLGSPDELINAPTYVEELANISHLLGDADYDFLINFARKGKELESFKRFVSSQAIDGLIIKAPEVDDPRIAYLVEHRFPFVVHGRTGTDVDYAYFDIDNEDVLIQSVDFLADLGHRSIAFINAPAHMAFAVQRRQGFVRAMANRNLEYPESYIQNALMIEEDGYNAGMMLLGENAAAPTPTAIICTSISQAYGLYHAARELGLTIGKELSIIAHDDVIAHLKSEHFDPPLTVTRSPFIDACKPLTDKIMALLSGTDASDLQTTVPIELIVRKSTARIK